MFSRPRLAIKGIIFGVVVTGLVTSLMTVVGMRSVIGSSEAVVAAYVEELTIVGTLRETLERESSGARAFLLTGDESFAETARDAGEELRATLRRLEPLADTPSLRAALHQVVEANRRYESALARAFAAKRAAADDGAVRRLFDEELAPAREALTRSVDDAAEQNAVELRDAEARAGGASRRAMTLGVSAAGLGIIAAGVLAALLGRASQDIAKKQVEVAQLLARVQRSNEELDAFSSRVAHDVRNALAPIAMACDILRTPGLAEATRERTTTALIRSVERTSSLVDALLAFSRAGRAADPDPRASVRGAVAGVLDELAPGIAATNVEVAADVADVDVRCPSALLHLVLVNLLGNAVKFLRGCDERRVSITSRLIDSGCELRVEDSGPGIPPEARTRVFDPFFRAAGTTAPGSGIGLATVHRIVVAHGGRVEVEAARRCGATFLVWLPLAGPSHVHRRDGPAPVSSPQSAASACDA